MNADFLTLNRLGIVEVKPTEPDQHSRTRRSGPKSRTPHLTLSYGGIALEQLLHHHLLALTGNLEVQTQNSSPQGRVLIRRLSFKRKSSVCLGFITHSHICHHVIFQRQLDPVPAEPDGR